VFGVVAAARIVAYNRAAKTDSPATRGDTRVPFTNLLKQLVSSVEGATGALMLESDGEAVQWYSRTDGERLRLRSAYLATVLKSCRAATESMNLGGLGHLVLNYDGASFVIQELSPGYYLVLEMSPFTNVAEGIHNLKRALPELRREFEA
jgi:predicted regulator of Ras-like GTPase activity (Roadblock/LC7/MglB family)